jgi:uncharacterized membrane protein YkvA (DUF1232 family)
MSRQGTAAFAGAGLLLDRGMRDQLRLAWRLMRDPRVTALKFVLPVLLSLYIVSPIDPIPDFLLGLGQTDDIGAAILVAMIVTRLLPKLAPQHVVEDHLRQMSGSAWTSDAGAEKSDTILNAHFSVRD